MFGCFNVRSAVDRAALVHTTIADHGLDVLALQETWFNDDDPVAKLNAIAPDGFSVMVVNRRPPTSSGRRGARAQRAGGLAIVYRQELDVKVHRLQTLTTPTKFEQQLVVIKSGKSPGVIVANLYRPPEHLTASAGFFDELADLISTATTSSGQDVIVCGDLNCAGNNPFSVDSRLMSVFDAANMTQLVTSPTREDNLLDVIACSGDRRLVHDVTVDENGRISDHRLLKARLSLGWRRSVPVTYKYRQLKNIDFDLFEAEMLSSALFTDPAA